MLPATPLIVIWAAGGWQRHDTRQKLDWVPPVEKKMAALTSLSPDKVTADQQWPLREDLHAAGHVAHAGNALAILFAAIRRTVNTGDHYTNFLVDAALTTHS